MEGNFQHRGKSQNQPISLRLILREVVNWDGAPGQGPLSERETESQSGNSERPGTQRWRALESAAIGLRAWCPSLPLPLSCPAPRTRPPWLEHSVLTKQYGYFVLFLLRQGVTVLPLSIFLGLRCLPLGRTSSRLQCGLRFPTQHLEFSFVSPMGSCRVTGD